MQEAALRGVESAALGCDLAGAYLRFRMSACLGVQSMAQTPGLFETRPRISLRIQITLRCGLRWGVGHRAVNGRLPWR